MRITHATIDELNGILMDLVEDTGSAIRDAADTWLDEDADREDRAEAREILESEIDNLKTQVEDLNRLLGT
jgi:gas vesicle protein